MNGKNIIHVFVYRYYKVSLTIFDKKYLKIIVLRFRFIGLLSIFNFYSSKMTLAYLLLQKIRHICINFTSLILFSLRNLQSAKYASLVHYSYMQIYC